MQWTGAVFSVHWYVGQPPVIVVRGLTIPKSSNMFASTTGKRKEEERSVASRIQFTSVDAENPRYRDISRNSERKPRKPDSAARDMAMAFRSKPPVILTRQG